jgi:hypothetical protein
VRGALNEGWIIAATLGDCAYNAGSPLRL